MVVLLPTIAAWRFLDRGRMARFPRANVVFPGSLIANGVDKPIFSTQGRWSESQNGGPSLEGALRETRGLTRRGRRSGGGTIDGVGRESSSVAKHGPRRLLFVG